ncbi:penicillin-binding transpeptidase domain-containing protein [uncultured Finegoldia sp.]|uniref:penicillin-binding transpeptidase domain-containing protein n=1 Tax=uncultured Finegoldia sp. TaxID=328009 RepID=UPI002620C498|nr:penicillin-binding transpeptidase domain-containing protein [uncultured Finegoldia sp.]
MRRKKVNPNKGKINIIFNKSYNYRIVVLFCILMAIVVLIIGKLVYLQLTPAGDKYRKLSARQSTNTIQIEAERGKILDRKGEVLADNVVSNNLYVNATYLNEKMKSELIDALSKNINIKKDELKKNLDKRKTSLVKFSLTKSEIDNLKKLPTDTQKFISVLPEKKRYYPNKEMLAQVLGFTNLNNDGVVGLESYYNSKLKGKAGKRILNSSVNKSIDLSNDSSIIINPQNGFDLKTTIDSTIQGFVEDSLKDIDENFKPKSATIIVMNPNNGEVLGMGSFPSFNPNDAKTPIQKNQIDELNDLKKQNDENKISKFFFKMWENKAVSWTYEPGSVFKTITSAAAREEHTATNSSHYFCNGFIRDIPGVVIRCERYWNPHGDETFQQAFNNSCNIAYVHIGRDLGKANMQKYITGFGFNQKTDIDLPSEEIGLAPKKVSEIDAARLATLSYGHGISATPIQMLTALNSIVNGGMLIEPHIAKEFISKDTKKTEKIDIKVKRQIISSKSSAEMNKMLQGVVDDGSGKKAQVKGYAIGGKTGTSIKIVDGKYTDNKTTASFFASFPTDHPEYTIIVVVDEPQRKNGGSAVCAPSAGKIISSIIEYKRINKTRIDADENGKVLVPDIEGLPIKIAVEKLNSAGLKSRIDNSDSNVNSIVKKQQQAAYSKVDSGSIIGITAGSIDDTPIKIPEIVGFRVEDAVDTLKDYGIKNIEIKNGKKGKVVRIVPEENKLLNPKSYIKIYIEQEKNKED